MTDLGVLLPLRIETRFFGSTLKLRVVPDEPWFTRHDERPTEAEVAALDRYAGNPGLPAWRELATAVGAPRAAFLVRTYLNAPPAQLNPDPVFPQIVGLPDQLQVWLARGGAAPQLALTLTVDHARLGVAFDPATTRWWEDWDEALDAGLAGEIPLGTTTDDIDLLLVTGIGQAAPGDLFAAHRDEGRLGLVTPGTPTNAVDGAPAAGLAQDADTWWALLTAQPGENEQLVSRALTGDAATLGPLPGADEPHFTWSSAMVAGLWPALWGFAATDVWALPRARDLADWARAALFPEGPFPAVRVGSQPYGLLPATALSRWVADPADLESAMQPGLLRLRELWQAAAERRGTVAGATTEQLLDLIGHLPSAPSYRHHRAAPLEVWWLWLLLLGGTVGWQELDAQWHATYPLSDQLGLDPLRRYGAHGQSVPLRMPLVVPAKLPAGHSVGEILKLLTGAATRTPAQFRDARLLELEIIRLPMDSLLLRLAIRSLQVAIGDVGREALGDPVPALEPLSRHDSVPGTLERWIGVTTDLMVMGPSPAARAFRRVVEGLRVLAGVPEERLDGMLRACVDAAGYRLDPWLSGPPTRRLQELLDQGVTPRLGAYGWVDAPRPGTPGPTAGGLLHAPTAEQALTATVLRDRAVNDPEPGRWHMDLTSRTVRAASALGESVRAGAHLSEALGREVERIAGAETLVNTLRTTFPVRTEHAGRRVCDGLAVLAADPATLGFSAGQLDQLDELRAAVDAYGDLLVAEAVHHVTQGRASVAGAAMDAAAGLSRPPELEVVATRRQGRAVATSVLFLIPDVAAPALPADPLDRATLSPAALADASAATFVADRCGDADAWRWDVEGDSGTATVSLADLGLTPADALALPLSDLERLVVDQGLRALGDETAEIVAGDGSARYEAAARLVGVVGRIPAGPDATTTRPEDPVPPSGVEADLAARYLTLHETAEKLVGLLASTTDPDDLDRLVVACRGWGVAPDPPPGAAEGAAAVRAHDLLAERLAAAPPDGSGLDKDGLTDAITRLVSPTGQLAILSRTAPPAVKQATLDLDWLTTVAAVRAPLARLEAEQLHGPVLASWASKPSDPWQQDPSDTSRLVVAYAPAGLDLSAVPSVAAAVLDRWTEVIPDTDQATAAAFGFDAPAARAPQAILLAVPPDAGQGLDEETVRDIVAETRLLAHARMARPADVDPQVRSLLPTALLPMSGRTATPLF